MKYTLFLFLILLIISGCNNIYNEHQDITNMAWHRQNLLTFKANIPEPKEYTVNVHLRHTSHIQIGNIAVKLVISPENQPNEAITQELLIPIRDKTTGDLVGEAMGDICDTSFATKVTFKSKGAYTLTLEHQMEDDKVEAIMEIGISIEK
jgi:gliding motility-associated lipoprotein GldH